MFIAGFLGSFFSFETSPYLFILGFYPVILNLKNKKWHLKKSFLFLFLLGFSISMPHILHFLQNTIALNGFRNAFVDIKTAFVTRTVGNEDGFYLLFKHFARFLYSTVWFYGSILILLCGYGCIFIFKNKKINDNQEILILLVVLLFSSFSWQILMKQHAMVHVFTPKHFIFFIILFAVLGVKNLIAKNRKLKFLRLFYLF